MLEDSYRAYLRERKSAILQHYAVAILGVGEGVVPVPPFEPSITRLPAFLGSFKEAFERPFQSHSNILQDLRIHLAHERIAQFPFRKAPFLFAV